MAVWLDRFGEIAMSPIEGFFAAAALTLAFGLLVPCLVLGGDGGASLTPLERAEKRLEIAGNIIGTIFLVFGIVKLAARTGWIAQGVAVILLPVVAIPLLVAFAVYLKASVDVKRARAAAATPSH